MPLKPLLGCVLTVLLAFQSLKADVVAIFACDTHAQNIEESVSNDLQNMRDEALRIAVYTNQILKELIFDGDHLFPNNFFKALESHSFTDQDIVLFYFSGHGYRTYSKDNKNCWPNLFFTLSGLGVDYGQVLETLSTKKHRLLLAVADCCNNYMKEFEAPRVYSRGKTKKIDGKLVSDNYKKLFLYASGDILVCSSRASEFSWCYPQGALFTLAFLEELKKGTGRRRGSSWDEILYHASEKVSAYQTVVSEISLKE